MNTEKLFKTVLTERQASNSRLNHDEFMLRKTVLDSYPRRIVLELTNKCNFQCIMCGRQAADFQANVLPMAVVKSCEPFFPYAEEVTLFGWGEGTLHPGFSGILKYLDGFDLLRKYFVTNGSTLPKIINAVFEYHVDLIAVSIDGATPETNDAIRKGGSLEREMRSLKKLVEEKEKRGLDYPYVNFVFTAMASNIAELPAMVELAHEAGIPEVKVVYLTVFDEGLSRESLYGRQETVKKYFCEAREAAARLDVKLKLPDIQGESEAGKLAHKTCAFPWRDLYIGSDGFLRPCQSSAQKLLNIHEYKGLAEIWNSGPMQEQRLTVNDEKLMSATCARCYQSTYANWNMRHSFLRFGLEFSPRWEIKEKLLDKEPLKIPGAAPQKELKI